MPPPQAPRSKLTHTSGYLFAAIRAKLKFGFHPPAALATTLNPPIGGNVSRRLAGFIRNDTTPVALQEALPQFHPEKGNEEEAQVMVQTLEPSGGITAARADPWLVIELYLPKLYATDKNESASPPGVQVTPCLC